MPNAALKTRSSRPASYDDERKSAAAAFDCDDGLEAEEAESVVVEAGDIETADDMRQLNPTAIPPLSIVKVFNVLRMVLLEEAPRTCGSRQKRTVEA
jgi:hypothetical protein